MRGAGALPVQVVLMWTPTSDIAERRSAKNTFIEHVRPEKT